MANNFRNTELLGKLERHPLRVQLARALDVAEAFAADIEHLTTNRDLSPVGRDNARRAKLRAAVRDLREVARAPIVEMQKRLDAKRAAVAVPAFDSKDIVGFLKRQELRSVLRTMDTGQRELTLNDPMFADAMLETSPVASGLFLAEGFNGTISPEILRDRDIVARAKEKRLAGMFGPQLEEIDELEKTVAEANMIADIARNDLKLHSGMDDRVFTDFCKPIESKRSAVWLKKDKDFDGNERTIVLDFSNPERVASRTATPDEIRDGKFYKDFNEYQADRAA